MKEMKILGVVKWYKPNKNYGYIIGSDEEKYFFELIDCVNKNEILKKGDVVRFIPNFDEFQYASEVEKA